MTLVEFGISYKPYQLYQDTKAFIKEFKQVKAHFPKVNHWIVVFDTLNRNLSPGADENSNADLGKAINNLINDIKPLGATVLIAHHTNKNGDMRGFSGLKNNVDVTINCTCEIKEDKIYTLTMDKVREGDSNKTYSFKGKEIDLQLEDETTSYTLDYLGDGIKKPKSKKPTGNLRINPQTLLEGNT